MYCYTILLLNIIVIYFLGSHGYSNKLPNMHPIFIAHGPAFKKGYKAEPFASIDLYPLLCRLLDIEPRLNNGSFEAIKQILVGHNMIGYGDKITIIICEFCDLY